MTQMERWRGAGLVSVLTVFALAVQGYHPYAEDGGLYVAGIKKMLNPALYPVRPEFVLAHLRFSPFATIVAEMARMTHLPLAWVLLALDCASVWATLYAGWMVASRFTTSLAGRCGAVVLFACWLTIPIAGTSLMLMDPYVTARSVSTPLALLAVAWAMDALEGNRRAAMLCGVALVLALVHPLMAGYGLATVIVLVVVGSRHAAVRRWGPVVLGALALAVAGLVQAMDPAESAEYVRAAMTRRYWFPLSWHWYELFGLIAPLSILYLWSRKGSISRGLKPESLSAPNTRTKVRAYLRSKGSEAGWRLLARMAMVLGAIALVVALVFARAGMTTHLVARLQPLRCFQMVYEVMILMLGAWLGERWLGRQKWRWALVTVVLGGVMFFVQRSIFPASHHFEVPGQPPKNAWSQAFVWVGENTPEDALFALDANYITRDGEDAQGFRGTAERSALPDYSKDGGEASITPDLAAAWVVGQAAQTGLSDESDDVRAATLRPRGVTWVVLQDKSTTAWVCPYHNGTVKVCRVPAS